MTIRPVFVMIASLIALPAPAQNAHFHSGAAIPNFGKIADVASDTPIQRGTIFKVAFDNSTRAERGKLNRTLDAAARFINMHAAAGVPVQDIHLALVFHGQSLFDLTSPVAYARSAGDADKAVINANAPLIATLIAHGVEIYACGQSAATLEVAKADLLPGVKMSLSAMTAHALLQNRGYTLNPF